MLLFTFKSTNIGCMQLMSNLFLFIIFIYIEIFRDFRLVAIQDGYFIIWKIYK